VRRDCKQNFLKNMTMKVGDQFEIGYQVTEKIYNGFIEMFDDKNPLHTDEQFAIGKNFSGKVMHGAILTCFLSNFIGEQLPIKNVIVLTYKISFTKPVYLGDKLVLAATIAEIFDSVKCVNFKYQFKNSQGTTVSKGEISIRII
jgi:3-hydroxybutyryl-CoA dehydratase